MNLNELRDQFHKHTSSLSSDLSDSDVDVYLNRAYQYTIPLDVGGEFTEAIWELECVIDQAIYLYPEPMVSASGKEPWIDSVRKLNFPEIEITVEPIGITYLSYETDPVVFKRKYLYGNKTSGRPRAALFYGKRLTLASPPDDIYNVSIPVRSGPIRVLDSLGIGHGTHARAIVSASALEYLSEIQDADDPGAMREYRLYTHYQQQLQTYALARPTQRNYTRSF
jgi:hypothetical protein